MSYYAEICFKSIEAENIFSFFSEMKRNIPKAVPGIAKENYAYCPLIRFGKHEAEAPTDIMLNPENEDLLTQSRNWVNELLSFRWFYNPRLKLLGVYGVPDALHHLFDGCVAFQDSTDQDYDRSEWAGIKPFEDIYDKCMRLTPQGIDVDEETRNECEQDEATLNYYRRSECYKEIWKLFEYTLYDDAGAVYISMLERYDVQIRQRIIRECLFRRQMELQKEVNT